MTSFRGGVIDLLQYCDRGGGQKSPKILTSCYGRPLGFKRFREQ